jgi:hypothetical protein
VPADVDGAGSSADYDPADAARALRDGLALQGCFASFEASTSALCGALFSAEAAAGSDAVLRNPGHAADKIESYIGACAVGAVGTAAVTWWSGPGVIGTATAGCGVGMLNQAMIAKGGNWKAIGVTSSLIGSLGLVQRAAILRLEKIYGKEAIGDAIWTATLVKNTVVFTAKITYKTTKRLITVILKS